MNVLGPRMSNNLKQDKKKRQTSAPDQATTFKKVTFFVLLKPLLKFQHLLLFFQEMDDAHVPCKYKNVYKIKNSTKIR